jgi:hypothetical protein
MRFLRVVRKLFITFVICLLIAVAIMEVIIRVTSSPQSNAAAGIYVAHDGYTAYQPNSRFQFTNERHQQVEVATDELGFRNSPGRARSARLLLLGDSFVAAINTIEAATLAGQLQASGYDVYNAGSDGAGTFNQLAILEKLLSGRNFSAVVLLFFTGNDFHDNFMTQDAVVAATAQRTTAAAQTPSPSEAPFGTLAARPSWRQKILDACQWSRVCQQLYSNVWLGQVRGYARDPWSDRRYFHMYLMTGAARGAIDQAVAKTRVALAAMKGLAARAGVPFVVVSAPSRSEVFRAWYDFVVFRTVSSDTLLDLLADTPADFDRPERTIRELCRDLQIPYHSLLSDMRAAPLPMKLYGVMDEHWMAEGEAIGAKSIAGFLSEQGIAR